MTRLPAILNVINTKFCVTFHARSWIIFRLQGNDSGRAWLAGLSTLRCSACRNIHILSGVAPPPPPNNFNDVKNDAYRCTFSFRIDFWHFQNHTIETSHCF
jgi:hypothetical protein